jgi:uncharacterized membrane protein
VRPLALAALLGVAGVAHLARPRGFDRIVPERLPGSPRTYTVVSGLAELGLAGALLVPATRSLAGRVAALFFVAVFPANLKMAVDVVASPSADTSRKVAVLLRLPLQIPLVTEALKVR